MNTNDTSKRVEQAIGTSVAVLFKAEKAENPDRIQQLRVYLMTMHLAGYTMHSISKWLQVLGYRNCTSQNLSYHLRKARQIYGTDAYFTANVARAYHAICQP